MSHSGSLSSSHPVLATSPSPRARIHLQRPIDRHPPLALRTSSFTNASIPLYPKHSQSILQVDSHWPITSHLVHDIGGSRFDESAGWESDENNADEEHDDDTTIGQYETHQSNEDHHARVNHSLSRSTPMNGHAMSANPLISLRQLPPYDFSSSLYSPSASATHSLASSPTPSPPRARLTQRHSSIHPSIYSAQPLYNEGSNRTLSTSHQDLFQYMNQVNGNNINIELDCEKGDGDEPVKGEKHIHDEKDDDDDDDSSDEDEDPIDAAKPLALGAEFMTRVIMCVISLALLWITSLTLANYITSFVVQSPDLDAVYQSWVASFAVADRQATIHNRCVERVVDECSTKLNASIAASQQEWSAAELRRQQYVVHVQATSQSCQATSQQVVQDFKTWLSYGAQLKYDDSSCTPADIETTRTLLGDRRVNAQGLQSLANGYMTATNVIFNQTTDQLGVLQAYNSAYLHNQTSSLRDHYESLGNQLAEVADPTQLMASIDGKLSHLKMITEEIKNCAATMGKNNSFCPTGTFVDAYSKVVTSFSSSFYQLQLLGKNTVREVVLYTAEVQNKFDEVQRFFNLLYPVADVLSSVNINVLNMPQLNVPPYAPNQAFVDAMLEQVSIPPMGSYFEQRMIEMDQVWIRQWNSTREELERMGQHAFENVTRIMTSSLHPPDPLVDYHPPPVEVNVYGLRNQLEVTQALYAKESADGIQHLIDVATTLPPSVNNSDLTDLMPSNVTFPVLKPPVLSTMDLKLEVESFNGNLSFSEVIIGLLTAMGGVFVIGDIIYRNLASIRTIYTYVKEPQDMLPAIDMRTARNREAVEKAKMRSASLAGKVLIILQKPIVVAILLVVITAWLIAIFLAVYIPMYQSYEEGCVNSRDGTFLSRNSNVLLLNYASLKGNTDMLLELAAYEATRSIACGREQERLVRAQSQTTVDISSDLVAQRTAWQNMDYLKRCVATLDLSLGTILPTMDPRLLLTQQTMTDCKVDANVVSNMPSFTSFMSSSPYSSSSLFDCSHLPTCTVSSSCPGPDPIAIKSSSHDSSCHTEYALHEGLFYGAFTLIIFGCLNLSRLFAIKAMVRIGWKALTPNGITFMATCDHRGKILVDEKMDGNGNGKDGNKEDDDDVKSRSNQSDANDDSDHFSTSGSESESESDSDVNQVDSNYLATTKLSKRAQAKVDRAILNQHIHAYEGESTQFLMLTMASHLPYLLLLLVLKDPFDWGSSLKISPPRSYSDQ